MAPGAASRIRVSGACKLAFAGQAALLILVSTFSIAGRTVFDAPPRFDGAGYAVLAESLRLGEGYRAIDHPDRPRHAHFPPGYPLALAALWSVTGPSVRAAHTFSLALTVGAVLSFWVWFRARFGPGPALWLGLALAVNWSWGRIGGAIQSEPLFLLLSGISLLTCDWSARGSWRRGVILGGLLGACVLTRHVGVMLAVAVLVELTLWRRWSVLLAAVISLSVVLFGWIAWIARVRQGTQVGLFSTEGLLHLVPRQLAFYVQRMPDVVTGPLVEVGTVFQPSFRIPVLGWACLASAFMIGGWIIGMRRPRWRLAALVPLATLSLLIVWPFTEAGRFLIPLLPFLFVGLTITLATLFRRLGASRRWARTIAALAVLGLSIPYSAYALVTARHLDTERSHASFDKACAWLAGQPGTGPVLVRQSGETFWLMGRSRPALPPPVEPTAVAVAALIDRYAVAYLVLDQERYVYAASSVLEQYVREHPGRVEPVFREGPVVVYAVRQP